jgi:hypothetical protein
MSRYKYDIMYSYYSWRTDDDGNLTSNETLIADRN